MTIKFIELIKNLQLKTPFILPWCIVNNLAKLYHIFLAAQAYLYASVMYNNEIT